ncbi:NACHT domain-containing protein [Pedobacter duraquae]|uniref:NACHT domain-containing protein n=1 Tax=Pedobacter duraquae TaxID=425511 RepID=A0A4R6IDE2_9SPHI|nr:hypothetical protein [Pedobacter duraquae]TDO19617.1 hypothetical protein CLV32_4240 [Pedobacter duraquae]
MDDASILNELKSLILLKTGIRSITPADCKRISIEISKTLNKNVSETTIKRLFGFAVVKHKFSKFTLTTLSEYVDKDELLDAINPSIAAITVGQRSWIDVAQQARRLTEFTLKGIRNRSGLPYDLTINRKFAEHDFEDFYNSDHIFMSFISQPGYGRTTMLSHLVDNSFLKDESPYKDSVVLFVNAQTVFNKINNSFNLEDQIKALLSLSDAESLIPYFKRNLINGKLIIIIDGFAELVLKRDLKNQLFDSLINFVCLLEDSVNIKMILSMRSTTWMRFYDRMRHSPFLRSAWFQGNYFNLNDVSNVPPLTEKELDQIFSKMNTGNKIELSPRLKAQLKFPFHIQLYYQLKEEDPDFNYYTNISSYELISKFIQEKIYRSNYYTEKILFLKKIIKLTDYGKSGNSVSKDLVINELSAFKNAYMELLSDGILMEEKRYENAHPKEFVRFIHPHVFEYFLFVEILEKFNLNVDATFFDYIHKEYDSHQVRFILLQWTIRFMVKIAEFNALIHIFKLVLSNYEKNYLILFIAENLKYRFKHSPDTIDLLRNFNLHDAIIKELTNFDFIDSCYVQAITVLAEVSDTREHCYIYQSMLCLVDLFSLDHKKIQSRIEILEHYDSTPNTFLVSPIAVAKMIHAKVAHNSTTLDPVWGLTRQFMNDPGFFGKDANQILTTPKAISYLLMLMLNIFYGTQQDAMQIIRSIKHLHPKIFREKTPFSLYLLAVFGLGGARSHPCAKVNQIEQILLKVSSAKDGYSFTKYSESLVIMLVAQQSANREEFDNAIRHAQELIQLYNRNQLNLNVIFAYNLIISIYVRLNDSGKVNDFKYEKLCFMEDRNIPKHLFPIAN